MKRARQAVVVACLLLAGRGNADAQPASPTTATPAIVITYDPADPRVQSAIEAIRSYLTGMPIQLLLQLVPNRGNSVSERLDIPGELATEHQAIGAFSLEISPRGDLLVFFTEPDGRSALIRRVRRTSNDVSVVREEAAIVVRSLVQALLDGKRIGMMEADQAEPWDAEAGARKLPASKRAAPNSTEREKPEPNRDDEAPPAPEDATPPPPGGERPTRVLALVAGYVGTTFASDLGWQSGLSSGLRWYALPNAYAGAAYTFFPSIIDGTQSATISLARHPVELAVGYDESSTLAPTVEFALLLDVIRRSTLGAGPELVGTPQETRVAWGVGLRGGLTWAPLHWLRGTLRGGTDIAAKSYTYVSRNEVTETVISPSTFRLRLDATVAISNW